MITYVDTSVIIKLIVDEPGSDAAGELWDTSDVLAVGRVGYVEARAALAAAKRGQRLTTRQLHRAKATLDDLWTQVTVVEVTEELVAGAADLAETENLRGYDAVHLAAAIEVAADVIASADRDLLRAAAGVGLHTADPTA